MLCTIGSLKLWVIHQPGVNNELADYLLRNPLDPTEWHLSPLIAQHLFWRLGRPEVDLFSSHRNHELHCWFSQTGRSMAAASDALSQSWIGLSLFAFPLIHMLERTLIKIREDQVEEVTVIAPCYLRRSWYHLLLQMTFEIPLLLPHRWDLLSQSLPDKGVLYHTDLATLHLMAWKLSSMPSRTKTSDAAIRTILTATRETSQRCIMADGRASLASVVRGVRISLAHLCSTSRTFYSSNLKH